MMPTNLPWVDEVKQILDKAMPAGAKIKAINLVLFAHGKAWHQHLNVDQVLPHVKNRGGRILIAGDVHTKGLRMVNVGPDIDLVDKSVAWELPEEPLKSVYMKQLKQLIENSEGLLAPINGSERVMSTDASHTTAFCKASKHGCATIEDKLKDKNGNLLPPSSFKGDFVTMCEKGWEWCIISRDVEVAFPKLPELFQRALNTKHAAVTRASEIEVAKTLCELSQYMSLTEATEEIRNNEPQCAAYISKVALYVEHFSGQGDLINFLDEFSKALGCTSASLGSEFMSALADLKVKSGATTLPFCRLAIWLTQVTQRKVTDGIAKHLGVHHINKLRNEKNIADVEALELILKQGWELGPAASKDTATGNITGPSRLAYGKFAVRCILHYFGAERDSREPNGFKDLAEINDLYNKDIEKGEIIKPKPEKASKMAASSTSLLTLAETSDPRQIFLNSNKFLSENKAFICKDFGVKVFMIEEITDSLVVFVHKPLFGEAEKQSIPYTNIKEWRAVNSIMPSIADEKLWSLCLPENLQSAKDEALKAKATIAMHSAYESHSAKSGYGLSQNPTTVFIKEPADGSTDVLKFNKGDFKICMYGLVKPFKLGDKVDEALLISSKSEAVKFQVAAPKKLISTDSRNLTMVSPYFLVDKTDDPTLANMRQGHVTVDGWAIPMLVNTRQIKSQELLYFSDDDGKGSSAKPPTKKARKA
jgi:hypothetical protein